MATAQIPQQSPVLRTLPVARAPLPVVDQRVNRPGRDPQVGNVGGGAGMRPPWWQLWPILITPPIIKAPPVLQNNPYGGGPNGAPQHPPIVPGQGMPVGPPGTMHPGTILGGFAQLPIGIYGTRMPPVTSGGSVTYPGTDSPNAGSTTYAGPLQPEPIPFGGLDGISSWDTKPLPALMTPAFWSGDDHVTERLLPNVTHAATDPHGALGQLGGF